MSQATTVEFSQEQHDRLAAEAGAMGLTIPAYIEFLANGRQRLHDGQFVDAARFMMSKHDASLRKLAR
ncbi:MAG: hypothetical protein ACKVS8_03110 [Phycisphaerales bacterium]